MKITIGQLRRIINEEVQMSLSEGPEEADVRPLSKAAQVMAARRERQDKDSPGLIKFRKAPPADQAKVLVEVEAEKLQLEQKIENEVKKLKTNVWRMIAKGNLSSLTEEIVNNAMQKYLLDLVSGFKPIDIFNL